VTPSRRAQVTAAAAALVTAAAALAATPVMAQVSTPVFVNEIHYDNTGTDVNEAIEVAGPAGTDLTGWNLVLYNGNGGTQYGTLGLSGTLPDQGGGFGAASVAATGLQNGAPDGVALVDAAGAVIQFLSYEGTFVAADGPAAGTSSVNIGVSENGTGPADTSLQLTGTGRAYEDFTWVEAASSFGAINAGQVYGDPAPPTEPCSTDVPLTLVSSIQGSGPSTPRAGERLTVEAVVTAVLPGVGGFYVQEEGDDVDGVDTTSEGIFVFGGSPAPTAGDLVRVTGTASEFVTSGGASSQTQLTSGPAVEICSSGVAVPEPVDVLLPLATPDALEAYEGMRVRLPQDLVISEYFNYDRFGEVVLGLPREGEDRLQTPTAVVDPGPAAQALAAENELRQITLDDTSNAQNPSSTPHPGNGAPFSLENRFRGGDIVTGVVGVIDHTFAVYRLQPTTYGSYTAANPRPEAPPTVGGDLRVSGFNVLNYFLTQGSVCGPLQNVDCRGADDANEFARQRAKTLAALERLDADVVGLIELENTPGVDPVGDLVAGLNDRLGAGTYAAIDTGVIGTDAIRVGFIYQPAVVQPVGPYAVLDSSDDPRYIDTLNRPALIQTFDTAAGERLTVTINHFKSKGSDCNAVGDPDVGDGQGNCNITRTRAAQALADYLATDPTGSGDPDRLIIGDLNSYDEEDPIRALEAAGYEDQIERFGGELAYGYVFDGQVGYLDHALASPSLVSQVTGAAEWHINADEPDLLDYDTTFKSPAQDELYAPDPFRSADHDPVLVGLDLTRAAPSTCYVGGAQTVTSYQPGTRANGLPIGPLRDNPAAALGTAASDRGLLEAVSLGIGGQITLGFERPIQNLSGPDLRVVPARPRLLLDRGDQADVSVSADGVTYVELGRLSNLDEGSFDLGSLPAAKYVRVTDRSAATGFPGLRDGFDLDAVDVLSGCA
jgi:uncharacterized protein